MATAKNDAPATAEQNAAQGTPTFDPAAGDLIAAKEEADILAKFHETHAVPAGYSIGRDLNGWVVRKV